MSSVNVTFEHLRYELPDEQLQRYGSPYFDERTAGLELIKQFVLDVTQISSHDTVFDARHILCANEAFPEAALADPLADLEVWDDWRTGLRAFPYPGTYSKLGITQQEAKTSATSSVGVLGEIMAGLYAQAGIAPWVLVRVIRHWPDFIFSLGSNRYAFVEAKAFTTNDAESLSKGIPNNLLGECLLAAVHQLNSDPFVQVWGAFTNVQSISPQLKLHVIFLELDASDKRRSGREKRILPDVIVDGLAERAINTSLHRVDSEYMSVFVEGHKQPAYARRNLEAALLAAAMQELEGMLVDQELKVILLQSRALMEERVAKLVRKIRPKESFKTKRLFGILGDSSQDGLARVRAIGTGTIFAGKLTTRDYVRISSEWRQDWEGASDNWGRIIDTDVWRCGGAIFAISEGNLEGQSIRRP